MEISLGEVRHNRAGFEALVDLAAWIEPCKFEPIRIDMRATRWFDADMAAPFGAILYRTQRRLNTVSLQNIPGGVETILSKNGFLSSYGRSKIPDTWGTTISYQRLEPKDDRHFAHYLEVGLMKRPEMPKMTLGLRKRIRESVFEIFSNAVIHSQTELGIFSCGQFFPKQNRIDLSIADLGIGIKDKVNVHTGLNLSPQDAILWAMEGTNTTKTGDIPGGLGLKLLREFITLNHGCIRIVSDVGFCEFSGPRMRPGSLSQRFPGTVVNIEIRTDDVNEYALASELSPADIF